MLGFEGESCFAVRGAKRVTLTMSGRRGSAAGTNEAEWLEAERLDHNTKKCRGITQPLSVKVFNGNGFYQIKVAV